MDPKNQQQKGPIINGPEGSNNPDVKENPTQLLQHWVLRKQMQLKNYIQ